MESTKAHNPFALRALILFVGVVFGFLVGYLSENYLLGICVHLVVITGMDQLAHFLKLKPSQFCDPDELLRTEEITPEAFDRHYNAKRLIRLVSLAVATPLGLLFLSPVMFVVAFAIATVVGRFYTWYQLNIEGPRIVHDLPLSEVKAWREEQDEEVLRGLLGFGSYSYLETNHRDTDYNR